MAITLDGNNGITSPDFEPSSSTVPTNGLYLPAANSVGIATNGAERLRLDASGNLGIGVTSPTGPLDIAGSVSRVRWLLNQSYAYQEGLNAAGSAYADFVYDGNSHRWQTSSTDRMTLDASGNLVVGNTSANRRLELSSASAEYQMRIGAGITSSAFTYDIGRSTVDGLLYFYGNQSGANGYVFSGVNGERARIDSSGNFLVGTTSNPYGTRALFQNLTAGSWASFIRGNDYAKATMLQGTAGYGDFFYYNGTTSSFAGYIYISGGGVSYTSTSDARLKTNIVDSPAALNKVNKIKIRSFDWKNGAGSVEYGVVAQEVYAVTSSGVVVGKDKEDGSIDMPWGFDGSNMVPMLVKAIQELTQRLEALENK